MTALEKLRLERDHVDEYVRKFKALVREAGYDLREKNIHHLFITGLPFAVSREVKRAPVPVTFKDHVRKTIEAVNADYELTELFKRSALTRKPKQLEESTTPIPCPR
jgi:hypothetical protein